MKNRDKAVIQHTRQIDIITDSLDQGKAENIVTIDLRGKSDIADYMVIATGLVDRHVVALADNVEKALASYGYFDIDTEGKGQGHWVLVDAKDVIVHIFTEETRSFYNLEKMWSM